MFTGPNIPKPKGIRYKFDIKNKKSFRSGTTRLNNISSKRVGYAADTGNFPTDNGDYLSFDGTDDYILLDNLNYGNSNRIAEMSIFCWVRTTYNSGTVGTWNNNNWSILDFDRSEVFTFTLNGTGEVQMSGRDGTNNYFDIVGTQRCNDGEWHHIGWTYSSTDNKIIMYVDGEIDRTHTYANLGELGTGGSTRWGVIGDGSERSGSGSTSRNSIYFQGDIAKLTFYDDRVLTSNEIRQIYNAFKGRFL
jgi:hypothetical protein